MRVLKCAVGVSLAASGWVYAGPYAPAAGQAGSTAIAFDDARIVGWAGGGSIARGPLDIDAPSGPAASFGVISEAFGAAGTSNTAVVSLGDGGSATLTFAAAIRNGDGPDFAVFENSFSDTFLELAYVEVSSNGADFVRFPSVSLTQATTQVGGFGTLDPTNIHNLAGKYRGGFGTPFDLADLIPLASPTLDLDSITHVRVVDVVGRINAAPGNPGYSPSLDADGRIINDPYSTPFPSGGFDLDGVGVINQVPEPAALSLLTCAVMSLGRRRARSI